MGPFGPRSGQHLAHKDDWIGVYLNDHLAGAAGAIELARRAARQHGRDQTLLQQIAAEIVRDRAELLDIMARMKVPARRYKQIATWALEKLGRLKLNGRIFGRSPVSDVLEVEALRLAVEGKVAGWVLLRRLADRDDRLDPARLDRLIERAARQAELLEELRIRTAEDTFAAR